MTAPERPRRDGDRPDDGGPDKRSEPSQWAQRDAVRRQRRAEVFGDTLPDATSDEQGDDWGERDDRGASDEWLRRQVPPHHD